MDFPNIIKGSLYYKTFNKITNIINKCKYRNNLKDALIHHNQYQQNLYAPNLRKSLKTTFSNQNLSNIINNYLHKRCKKYNFIFNVVGHQDLLVYKKNNFFKFHRDFKKEFCEDTETYTLIIGLKCCLEGGRTIIKIKDKTKYYSESTIPGGFIMFKSTLLHAGEKVISDLKEILVFTVNVRRSPMKYDDSKLNNFILKKQYISKILQKLPYHIEQHILNYMCEHVYLQEKMSPKLQSYINKNNYIPMQVCVSHQKPEYSKIPQLDDINIFLLNGINFMKICNHIYYKSKEQYVYYYNKQFKKNCLVCKNGMFSNLYNKCNLTYYKKDNKQIKYHKKDIKFNTTNFNEKFETYKKKNNYFISQCIKNWFSTWKNEIPLNDEIKKVISHTQYATLMCNGGDDYEYNYDDETTTYTIHSKCFRYGFIVV